jgi:hypothetical protein
MRECPANLILERVLLAAGLALTVVAPASVAQQRDATATPASVENFPGPAAEVLALERQFEEAVVRGDVAFVDRVTSPDFRFVHGDGWTRGGQPFANDDKAAFLKRVADKEYLVHDLDDVGVEMHGDVAITYGRYVSLFVPPNRDTSVPARLSSIWFERVYARRNGQWQFLSHRTVHGPNVAPAGIDPTAEVRKPEAR